MRQTLLLPALLLALLLPTLSVAAADFELEDIHGKSHKLSDYRGRWVVVNYWASWCPPCVEEIPELVTFHDQHDDAVVLGINWEEIGTDELRIFADDNLIGYPILLGGHLPHPPLGRIPGLPTTYLISPDGEVAARQVGPVTQEMLESYIYGTAKVATKGE